MDRERYLKMRRLQHFDLGFLYEYYVNRTTHKKIDYNTFQQLFPMYFNSNMKEIISKLDSELNITVLKSVEGKELRFL